VRRAYITQLKRPTMPVNPVKHRGADPAPAARQARRIVIVSFLYALGRTLLFCINRAPFGVAKRAGQYVAELAANLAFHRRNLMTRGQHSPAV
jgi:hypothetical protein